MAGHLLLEERARERRTSSALRLGRLATLLFREEMGDAAADMARRAPIVSTPDPTSPVVQAALRGDTVAALGTLSGEMVLSVALGERVEGVVGADSGAAGEGSALQLRAITEPFQPRAPTLLRSRTGYAAAVYLRGRRVAEEPPGFGPDLLPPSETALLPGDPPGLSTPLGTAVLLPLDPRAPADAPVQILVAAPPELLPPSDPWREARLLLLGLASGGILLSWLRSSWGPRGNRGASFLHLLPLALPLGALWLFLLGGGAAATARIEEAQKREMIRVLALLMDRGEGRDLLQVAEASEYQLTRKGVEGAPLSTLPPGPLLESLLALPAPPPAFPTLGTVLQGGEPILFASLREEDGQILTLSAPDEGRSVRGLRVVLAGLGAAASLLALVFLLRAPPLGRG